jgi:hypothetical protein
MITVAEHILSPILTMEHYGAPDWDQTLTIIRVNQEKKISERINGTGIRKKIMITRR